MITKEEIQNILDKLYEKTDGECGDSKPYELSYYSKDEEYVDIFNGMKFEEEASGGTGSDFDQAFLVFKVTKDDQSVFIKFDGYYSSYDGSSYDNGFYFCESYVVPVTKWRKIK